MEARHEVHGHRIRPMTDREAIAHVLGDDVYGFGRKVNARCRLLIADKIIQALGAAGYVIEPKPDRAATGSPNNG